LNEIRGAQQVKQAPNFIWRGGCDNRIQRAEETIIPIRANWLDLHVDEQAGAGNLAHYMCVFGTRLDALRQQSESGINNALEDRKSVPDNRQLLPENSDTPRDVCPPR